MNNINFVKNGPDEAQLTISYVPASKHKVADVVPTGTTLTYSELIPRFLMEIANRYTPWKCPAMITDTWQWVSFQINLQTLRRIFPDHLKGQIKNIQLLFYMKCLETSQVESFNFFQTKPNEISTEKKGKILNYKSRFKILNGNTSIKMGKVLCIGFRIDDFVVKFLATDILVGSHQKQIKPPFNINDEIKKLFRKKTFWFLEAAKTEEKEAPKKRTRDEDEDPSVEDPLIEEEDMIKKLAKENPLSLDAPLSIRIVRDDLLFDLFPEALLDIEGAPYFPKDLRDFLFDIPDL